MAVVSIDGGLTVLRLEAREKTLSTVFHDGEAFPPGVIGAAVDHSNEVVVLTAGGAGDECWAISRATAACGADWAK